MYGMQFYVEKEIYNYLIDYNKTVDRNEFFRTFALFREVSFSNLCILPHVSFSSPRLWPRANCIDYAIADIAYSDLLGVLGN